MLRVILSASRPREEPKNLTVGLLLTMGHVVTALTWTVVTREAHLGVYWAQGTFQRRAKSTDRNPSLRKVADWPPRPPPHRNPRRRRASRQHHHRLGLPRHHGQDTPPGPARAPARRNPRLHHPSHRNLPGPGPRGRYCRSRRQRHRRRARHPPGITGPDHPHPAPDADGALLQYAETLTPAGTRHTRDYVIARN